MTIAMRPDRAQSAVCRRSRRLPGIGPKLEKLFAPPARPRRRAPRVIDLLFHLPTGAVDRRDQPKLREVVPGHGRHRRGHGRPPSAAAAEPAARALSDRRERRHRRRSTSPISTRARIIWRSSCRSASSATSRAPPRSTTASADGASRPRGRRGGLRQAAAGRAGLSADRRACIRNQVRKAIDARARPPAGPAGMAGRGLARAQRLSALCATRCAALHRPADAGRCSSRRAPAWSRLAYDELLAGQLALALVRAHMRRAAGPRHRRRRAICARSIIAALPYSLTPSQDARGRRHRRRSGAARTHAAAAARRCRLRQDRGGAARRRRP